MKFLTLTNALSKLQFADRPTPDTVSGGIYIALIYGFAAREHMHRNLLKFLRHAGYTNTTMYGHLQANLICNDLQAAASKGAKLVVIGYSQGGLESVRVANELNRRGVNIALLVTIAAGGRGGRFWPHRWDDNPRKIPENVARCLNYFSATDLLGTDHPFERNLAVSSNQQQHIENIFFTKDDGVSHLAITKCYPASKVHPKVSSELVQRIRDELSALEANCSDLTMPTDLKS